MGKGNCFGEYIANLRIEKNVLQTELCDGLCSRTMLSRFECGEREPEKLLQNRFLTRLGAVPENYENFLYYADYIQWERRQGILHHILEEDMKKAKQLLEEYYKEYDMEKPLERQFYLAMLAQIKRYEGAENTELADLFEKALSLTVPEIEIRGFINRVLSLEELNLLLEYIYCSGIGERLRWYEDLLQYIKKRNGTQLAMAKIYPKIVCYYYATWKERKDYTEESINYMKKLCEEAIELLRNANRMFYLWELLCMKEELAERFPQQLQLGSEEKVKNKEYRVWREVMEAIYTEYGVSVSMYEFCYLYVESENYCIGDVIRIRRKMLGKSIEKLRIGICSDKTISRLERNFAKTQQEIVKALFDKLNLSTELCRTELVTESQEAIAKYEELKWWDNNQNGEESKNHMKSLREELKHMISMDIPSNQQVLLRNEIINTYRNGELSKEEYVIRMKQALECTVPYRAVINSEEIYLTNEEIGCLQNITLMIDWSFPEMEECIFALIKLCEKPKYPINYLKMYQFIMSAVSCCLGNRGDYVRSTEIQEKILKLLLKNRRLGGVNEALYEILWNKEQLEKESLQEKEEYRIRLEQCICFSRLVKDSRRENAYRKKLKNLI